MIHPRKEDIGQQVVFTASDGRRQNGILSSIQGSACVVRFGSGESIIAASALDWGGTYAATRSPPLHPLQGEGADRCSEPLSRQVVSCVLDTPDHQ